MNAFTMRALAACAAFLLPGLAMAQPAPPVSHAAAGAIDQRIAALKARLAITPAEEASWDAFTRTMRDNAADTDRLFAQRTASAGTMTAPDNMHSYVAVARAYADDTERLSQAFDTLYAGLTDTQKLAADALFREQAAEGQRPALR